MPDNISNANRSARDPQRRITAATAIGMNALKPIMHVNRRGVRTPIGELSY